MKWIGTQTIYNDVRVRGNVNVERLVKITNTNTSSASEGGKLTLISNDGAALGDDHQLGRVAFQAAEDSSSTIRQGASIEAYADAAWSASENGTRLEFYINDGNNSIEKVLTLDSDRLATFAGAVTVTGALTGTLATATQPNIESIGTDGDSLHILADQLIMSNTSTDTPVINLVNTTDDDQAGQLIFEKLRDDDAVASGQNLGEIHFKGQDSAQNTEGYAYIIGEIDVSTGGQESGKLLLGVAGHDGSNRSGLILTGGSEASEVDVTVGLGANSVVTIPGSIAGDLTGDVTGDLTGQAGTVATIAGLAPNTATTQASQPNITGVGTIGTGVWEGTAVATDQQKHLAWFTVKGFGTGDGTNYDMPAVLDDDDAPWKHSVSAGSAGTTAIGNSNIARMGGIVAPRAGTLKRWTGWATTAGSSTANIALFKITPTRNDAGDVAPVLLDNVAYTALGNNKMEDFDETSFTDADIAAGDIIVSGINCQNNKTTYFASTLEIEWD